MLCQNMQYFELLGFGGFPRMLHPQEHENLDN